MSDPRLDTARGALDKALAGRPKLDGHAFTAATEAMCAYRDELRSTTRARPDDLGAKSRLKASNLIITLLLAGHYALGEIPWEQLEDVKGHIEGLKRQEPA